MLLFTIKRLKKPSKVHYSQYILTENQPVTPLQLTGSPLVNVESIQRSSAICIRSFLLIIRRRNNVKR